MRAADITTNSKLSLQLVESRLVDLSQFHHLLQRFDAFLEIIFAFFVIRIAQLCSVLVTRR
jgi:hypothetical protein